MTNEGGLDSLHSQRSPFDVAKEDLIVTLAVSFSQWHASLHQLSTAARKSDSKFSYSAIISMTQGLKFCRIGEIPGEGEKTAVDKS